MNRVELSKAFELLKPGKIVDSKDIAVGLSNTSYLLTTDADEQYVLRQLRLQTPENARTEARIQTILKDVDVHSPQYLTLKNNDVVGKVDRYNFTLAPYMQGERPAKPTLALARSFGRVLAKIHNGLGSQQVVIEPGDDQWLRLQNAQREIAECPDQLRALLSAKLEGSKTVLDKGLPKSVIHGDLGLENVFAEDDEITTVFDFETVEYTVRLLDIAQTYLSLAYTRLLDPHLLKRNLFEGYNEAAESRLTPEEIASFQEALTYVTVVCVAWLHNNNAQEYIKPFLAVAGIS